MNLTPYATVADLPALCQNSERLSSRSSRRKPNVIESQWTLPFDNILDVASFCAGAFDFKTYLNVALCCHEIHDFLKPVLNVPIVQLDAKAIDGEYKVRSILCAKVTPGFPRTTPRVFDTI
jgi:hypothetical protein